MVQPLRLREDLEHRQPLPGMRVADEGDPDLALAVVHVVRAVNGG